MLTPSRPDFLGGASTPEKASTSLVLLCLRGPVLKSLRRQAVVTLPVVQPRLFVAPQPAAGGATPVPCAMTPRSTAQHPCEQHRQPRHRQRRRPPFFPAWLA